MFDQLQVHPDSGLRQSNFFQGYRHHRYLLAIPLLVSNFSLSHFHCQPVK